jgi:hypothetical protein
MKNAYTIFFGIKILFYEKEIIIRVHFIVTRCSWLLSSLAFFKGLVVEKNTNLDWVLQTQIM